MAGRLRSKTSLFLIVLILLGGLAVPAEATFHDPNPPPVWTSSCLRQVGRDLLGPPSSASCTTNNSTHEVQVVAQAASEALPYGIAYPSCSYFSAGAACAISSATFNVEMYTSDGPLQVDVGLNDPTHTVTATSGEYYYGYGSSLISVSGYSYGYTCDWTWYSGWECRYSSTESAYQYVYCYPVEYCSAGGSSNLTFNLDLPYCRTNCSSTDPYASYTKVYVNYTISVHSSTAGSASAYGRMSGTAFVNVS